MTDKNHKTKPSSQDGSEVVVPRLVMQKQCYCKDGEGNHCPEVVVWAVNINQLEVFMCERCYENVKSGAYGKNIKLLASVRLPDINP